MPGLSERGRSIRCVDRHDIRQCRAEEHALLLLRYLTGQGTQGSSPRPGSSIALAISTASAICAAVR